MFQNVQLGDVYQTSELSVIPTVIFRIQAVELVMMLQLYVYRK